MKNKLKFLALLLILPVAFAFVACGQLDANAQVNTGDESKYEAVTKEDLANYISGAQEGEKSAMPSGARVTVDIDAGDTAKGKVNVLFKVTESEDGETSVEAAARLDIKAEVEGMKISANGDIFLKEEVLYIDIKAKLEANFAGQSMNEDYSGKYQIDLSEMGGASSILDIAKDFIPANDLPIPLNTITGMVGNFDLSMVARIVEYLNFEVSSYTDGDFTRFKLVTEDEDTGPGITAYVVFVKDVLAGVKINANMTQNNQEMKLGVAIEAFDGEINYPSLEGFNDELPDLF